MNTVISRTPFFRRPLAILGMLVLAHGSISLAAPRAVYASTAQTEAAQSEPLHMLGVGDLVAVQVFARPELSISAYVSDNGSLILPLVGAVKVAGLSPDDAATRIAEALRKGQFVLRPQVNITLQQSHSQQVSVLGQVHTPGRYSLESKTSVFDLLAQAGGLSADAADTGYLLRKDKSGVAQRLPIDLNNLAGNSQGPNDYRLKSGDSLFVPKSAQFYIYGEVRAPNRYKLERGMTLMQALTLGGGVTDRGSERRVEIRRSTGRGKFNLIDAHATDLIQADDVIRVKQRLF